MDAGRGQLRHRHQGPAAGHLAATASSALELLEVRILPLLNVIEPSAAVFRRAEPLLRDFALGLRAGDTLHLAMCLDLDQVVLTTADAALAGAARRLGQAAFEIH